MSRMPEHTGRVIYFGKVPSRGDFVKSRIGASVLELLDAWLAQGLELFATDPGWKAQYDVAAQVDFAFLGTGNAYAMAGRLAPSLDASRRRFPFVAATAMAVDDPLHLIARSPISLAAPWRILEEFVRSALAAEDPREAFERMADVEIPVASIATAGDGQFADFRRSATLAQVENQLREAGHPVSMRRAVLAIGLLLQPVLSSVGARLDKGLYLPLPTATEAAANVGAMWMDMIAPFLSRGEFELGVFAIRRSHRPALILNFNGASPAALRTLLDRDRADGYLINICEADWVEDYVDNDYAIKKLSSYLELPRLSLEQAGHTFREAFLGV